MPSALWPGTTGVVMMQNPSIWGPSIRDVIEQTQVPHIFGCPEVHLMDQDIDDTLAWWRARLTVPLHFASERDHEIESVHTQALIAAVD